MNITRKEVCQVADLARLDLDDAALDKMSIQINEVLGYVAQMNEVDTANVTPASHALSLTNAFREDEKTEHLDRKRALSNAPHADDETFVVPRVIKA